MEFKEFGKKGCPSVLLVEDPAHSFDEENLVSALLKDYYVIVPVQNGLETSAARAAEVEQYVQQQKFGKLFAICGTPEGWSLIREILARRTVHSDKVIVGSQENALGSLIIPMLEEYALEAHISVKG